MLYSRKGRCVNAPENEGGVRGGEDRGGKRNIERERERERDRGGSENEREKERESVCVCMWV